MAFRTNRFNLIFAAALALCIATALPGLAVAQNPKEPPTSGQTPDPLGRLKQALSDAGATALTTSQETALTTLIMDFRTANQPTTSATRLAYDNYILSGNAVSASALISDLQAEQAAQALAMAQAEVTFAADVVNILLTSQLNLLQQALGTDELVSLIQSLAGGAGGPSGGQGGPPPMK